MNAAAAGLGRPLSQPLSPQLRPPVHIGRGPHRMQPLFLSEKNLRGGSDSTPAETDTKKVTEPQGPHDSETPWGSKILKLVLKSGRVVLEALGVAFIVSHVAWHTFGHSLTNALNPGGGFEMIPLPPTCTGYVIINIMMSVIHAVVLIGTAATKAVPIFIAAAASLSGILVLTTFEGFNRTVRLLLDLAGVLALVWFAVESVQNGKNSKGNVK